MTYDDNWIFDDVNYQISTSGGCTGSQFSISITEPFIQEEEEEV
jgi:hypothetical protein